MPACTKLPVPGNAPINDRLHITLGPYLVDLYVVVGESIDTSCLRAGVFLLDFVPDAILPFAEFRGELLAKVVRFEQRT